jgi:hydroxyacylglutathione hydrolase
MALEIVTIPCLKDNYAFLAHDPDDGVTLLVDVPDAAPILDVLDAKKLQLTHVLLTHHHWDHVDGLADVMDHHSPQIIGAKADRHRLPPLNLEVSEGDIIEIGSHRGRVFDVSGHTIGHIAVHFDHDHVIFTADSLMALGCGRLFEGSGEMMWGSLSKLRALSDDTLVCSGHEYTASNAKFALSIDPENPQLIERAEQIQRDRNAGRPTVPSLLGLEKATNPFLRPDCPRIRKSLGMLTQTDAQVFTEIRTRKDNF